MSGRVLPSVSSRRRLGSVMVWFRAGRPGARGSAGSAEVPASRPGALMPAMIRALRAVPHRGRVPWTKGGSSVPRSRTASPAPSAATRQPSRKRRAPGTPMSQAPSVVGTKIRASMGQSGRKRPSQLKSGQRGSRASTAPGRESSRYWMSSRREWLAVCIRCRARWARNMRARPGAMALTASAGVMLPAPRSGPPSTACVRAAPTYRAVQKRHWPRSVMPRSRASSMTTARASMTPGPSRLSGAPARLSRLRRVGANQRGGCPSRRMKQTCGVSAGRGSGSRLRQLAWLSCQVVWRESGSMSGV